MCMIYYVRNGMNGPFTQWYISLASQPKITNHHKGSCYEKSIMLRGNLPAIIRQGTEDGELNNLQASRTAHAPSAW